MENWMERSTFLINKSVRSIPISAYVKYLMSCGIFKKLNLLSQLYSHASRIWSPPPLFLAGFFLRLSVEIANGRTCKICLPLIREFVKHNQQQQRWARPARFWMAVWLISRLTLIVVVVVSKEHFLFGLLKNNLLWIETHLTYLNRHISSAFEEAIPLCAIA